LFKGGRKAALLLPEKFRASGRDLRLKPRRHAAWRDFKAVVYTSDPCLF
jgi:hypothetical protein